MTINRKFKISSYCGSPKGEKGNILFGVHATNEEKLVVANSMH